MEIEAFIKKMKDINSALIDFIEATDDDDTQSKIIIDILEKQEILENKDEIRLLFQLISKIADNHHRTPDFFNKLEKILKYLIKDIPSPISYFIPDYTKYNKKILFLLLEKGYVKPDEIFLNQYLQSKPTNKSQAYYLYPKLKEFLEEKLQKQIEEEIFEKYKEEISTFEEKCQIGENDSYVCSLIRSDSVEEFITYVNRTNLSLLTKIKPSIYETHSFLIDKKFSLIEYAAFFGSIQIIQYLKYNNVPLTSSLWLYAIHSNNAELIHFLEENKVIPEITFRSHIKKSFDHVLIESIKCHHNAISNYIMDNFSEEIQADIQNHFYDNFNDTINDSLNFFFYPNEIESIISEPNKGKGFKLSQLCFSVTTITIPSSITSIGNNAFLKCSSIKQIKIPSSVTSFGNFAFSHCESLSKIVIPSSLISIGDYAFLGCKSLTKITIPSSVITIKHSAFSGCSSLTQVLFSIPSHVTSIGNDAFDGCSSLKQIIIPSSVTSIGNYAFYGCSSLTKISIPSSVTSFGDRIFNGIKSLEITGDIQRIPKKLFINGSSLKQITIPSSVISIGDSAFYGCSSLKQITIPSSVASIESSAFEGCSSLTQITIPSSVNSIGNNAFLGCSSLEQIIIPSLFNICQIGIRSEAKISNDINT